MNSSPYVKELTLDKTQETSGLTEPENITSLSSKNNFLTEDNFIEFKRNTFPSFQIHKKERQKQKNPKTN